MKKSKAIIKSRSITNRIMIMSNVLIRYKNNIFRINPKEDLAVIFFCIAYIVAVTLVLNPNYMSGLAILNTYSKQFSLGKSLLSLVMVFIVKQITYGLVNKERKVTFYLIRMLFFLYEIPIILSYGLFYHDNMFTFWISEQAYWIMLCLVCYFFGTVNINSLRIINLKMPHKIIRFTVLMLAVICLALSLNRFGGLLYSFSLSFVYIVRAYYKLHTTDFITFFKSAFGGYLCPAFIVYYLSRRKFFLGALMVVMQCFFFFLAMDKVYLFILPIAIAVGFYGNSIYEKFTLWMSRAYLSYGLVLFIAALGAFRIVIFELLTRRVMTVPSYLNYIYFDYFSKHTPIWWQQDTFLIDKLFTVVYPRSVPLQISHVYFKDLAVNPNAGMFAEAVSRCGYAGIIIYPLLLGVLLNIIDIFFYNVDKAVKIIIAMCFTLTLGNDVITSTSFVMAFTIILLCAKFFNISKNMDQICNNS